MSAKCKAWVNSEKRLGFRAAPWAIFWGTLPVVCAIVQAWGAAVLLAAVLGIESAPPGVAITVFALAALLRAGAQMQAERASFELGASARRRLRGDVLRKLFALGPAGLRGRHSGELAATAVDRVEALEGLHARWVPAQALAIIGPVLVMVAALWADPWSGLILLLAGLLTPFGMAVAGIGAAVAAKKQFLAMTRLQVRFLDRIRGISTIVLAGRARDEEAALADAATELRQRTMRVLRVAFLSSSALDLAAAAALVALVLRFAPALAHSTALVPTALFVLLLAPEFFAPLRNAAAVYAEPMTAEAVAESFCGLPPEPPEVPPADIRAAANQGISLAFEHVTFAYDETQAKVVENLSFRVGRGEILLLTGASGAGKSTIIDLILGFLLPQEGRITINGAELSTLVPSARSKLIGWIGQKPVLFAGSIEENIRFAKPQASDAEFSDAIRHAHLVEVIRSLPQGIHTPIGEGGFGLSGGQAQRLAIARAFLKDAPLLLLDEPTAHLDPATERDVLDSLKHLAMGRAVLLATHSTAAMDFAKAVGAKRLDLDSLRYASWRGVRP
jgi:ATP-binding cassette subfamily C protein CydD